MYKKILTLLLIAILAQYCENRAASSIFKVVKVVAKVAGGVSDAVSAFNNRLQVKSFNALKTTGKVSPALRGLVQSFKAHQITNPRKAIKYSGTSIKKGLVGKWKKATKVTKQAQKYSGSLTKIKKIFNSKVHKNIRKFGGNKKNWATKYLRHLRRKIMRKHGLSHHKYTKKVKGFVQIKNQSFVQVNSNDMNIHKSFKKVKRTIRGLKLLHKKMQVIGFGTAYLRTHGFLGFRRELKRHSKGRLPFLGNIQNTPVVRSIKTAPSPAASLAKLLKVEKKVLKTQRKIVRKVKKTRRHHGHKHRRHH